MNLRRASRFVLDIEADEDGNLVGHSVDTLDGWDDAVGLRERVERDHEVQGNKLIGTNCYQPAEVWVAAYWLKYLDGVSPDAVVNCEEWRGVTYKVRPADHPILGVPDGAVSARIWFDKSERFIRGNALST